MNSLPNSDFLARSSDAARPSRAEEVPSASRTLALKKPPVSHHKKLTVVDSRISSLKILALSLLRHIESLENQSSTETLPDLDLQVEVHRFEAELIRNALIRTRGRQRRAAHLLGMKVTTLNTKIKRYNIELGGTSVINLNGDETS